MATVANWLQAMRLRTLPLALAGIALGNLLAWQAGRFDAGIAALAVLTALLLQIVSNLANDYGDAQKGIDAHRRGPLRVVQGGLISPRAMRRAIALGVLAAVLSGTALIMRGFAVVGYVGIMIWLWPALGAAAVAAALLYTLGKRPYGYRGYGDIAVLVFFGWLAVLGSRALQTGTLHASAWWPATAVGLWSVMVLNLNNMRDRESDAAAGKYTLAVRLGACGALRYHVALLVVSWLTWAAYVLAAYPRGTAIALLLAFTALGGSHLWRLLRHPISTTCDRELPRWSISALGMVVLACVLAP